MFADYVKMAAKLALIVIVTAAIIALFNIVTIPNFNISAMISYMNIAFAFANNWCPAFTALWGIILALISLEVGLMVFDITSMAWRWIFKVNE